MIHDSNNKENSQSITESDSVQIQQPPVACTVLPLLNMSNSLITGIKIIIFKALAPRMRLLCEEVFMTEEKC